MISYPELTLITFSNGNKLQTDVAPSLAAVGDILYMAYKDPGDGGGLGAAIHIAATDKNGIWDSGNDMILPQSGQNPTLGRTSDNPNLVLFGDYLYNFYKGPIYYQTPTNCTSCKTNDQKIYYSYAPVTNVAGFTQAVHDGSLNYTGLAHSPLHLVQLSDDAGQYVNFEVTSNQPFLAFNPQGVNAAIANGDFANVIDPSQDFELALQSITGTSAQPLIDSAQSMEKLSNSNLLPLGVSLFDQLSLSGLENGNPVEIDLKRRIIDAILAQSDNSSYQLPGGGLIVGNSLNTVNPLTGKLVDGTGAEKEGARIELAVIDRDQDTDTLNDQILAFLAKDWDQSMGIGDQMLLPLSAILSPSEIANLQNPSVKSTQAFATTFYSGQNATSVPEPSGVFSLLAFSSLGLLFNLKKARSPEKKGDRPKQLN